jgi:hypothetical protein
LGILSRAWVISGVVAPALFRVISSSTRSQPTSCIAPALFACGVVPPLFSFLGLFPRLRPQPISRQLSSQLHRAGLFACGVVAPLFSFLDLFPRLCPQPINCIAPALFACSTPVCTYFSLSFYYLISTPPGGGGVWPSALLWDFPTGTAGHFCMTSCMSSIAWSWSGVLSGVYKNRAPCYKRSLMARASLPFVVQAQSLAHIHVGSSPIAGPLFWGGCALGFLFLFPPSPIGCSDT